MQSTPDPVLEELDAGERSAIQLAQQRGSVVLIDEYRGREVAARRGVQTIGTLGILLAASQRGIADGEAAFLNLVKTTSFRVSAHVRADFAAKFAVLRKKATE
ncbi:MAG: hypothetical protein HY046_01730 [Acidobacteria bacterium]|nr:hypothetical protein [Acidobacteriota bacterium]